MCAVVLVGMLLCAAMGCSSGGGKPDPNAVVVYCSQDQVYGEPILQAFEQKTGVKVNWKFDIESAKTTGLVQLLIAEKPNPRCDVFWNNEMAQTINLQHQGVLEAYRSPSRQGIPAEFLDADGYWTGIAARARIILYNTDLVKPEDAPKSIFDLTQPKWKGKVAFARPLFGTALTQAAALFQLLGPEKAKAFFEALKANDVILAEGNAHAKDLVASGLALVCLTDTDDANVALRDKKPVAVVFPDQDGIGTFMIPNAVMLIKGGPHPEGARKLIDYLCSKEVEEQLAHSDSAQLPLHAGVSPPPAMPGLARVKPMKIDYDRLGQDMKPVTDYLRDQFLR